MKQTIKNYICTEMCEVNSAANLQNAVFKNGIRTKFNYNQICKYSQHILQIRKMVKSMCFAHMC